MKPILHTINEELVTIHFYHGESDREEFYDWLMQPRTALAFDTETTGLDIFAEGFACRLAQFGDTDDAWVLPARYLEEIQHALTTAPLLACHNSNHDLQTADRHLGVSLDDLQPKTLDTMILSHLVDPRSKEDSSTVVGHGLKDLVNHYVDDSFADGNKVLKEVFKANGWTIAEGFTAIPEENEDYVRYSGLDVIGTARLLHELIPRLSGKGELVSFEHHLQLVLARMERRGLLVDVKYTTNLQTTLDAIQTLNNAKVVTMCRELGVAPLTPRGIKDIESVVHLALTGVLPKRRAPKGSPYKPMTAGSNATVAAAFLEMGEELTERTDSGAFSVGKEVLNRLCDVNKDDEPLETRKPNELAVAVKAAKRATKWRASYVDTILEIKDERNRIHPKIQGLKARTGRMAISRPPFQQLPSSGRMIRDCIVADPGHLLISCDYDQVEMKLLAGLCKDEQMVQVMLDGLDIFNFTAEKIYGPGYTKKQRGALKATGYGTCYGGGPKTISEQTGLSLAQAKEVQAHYHDTFPGIRIYSKELETAAMRDPDLAVHNFMGRKLPLDKDRTYAALNYMIQSTARDVFAKAIVRLDKAGLGDYLLLPVHDEMIAQAPEDVAEDIARQIGEQMSDEFNGVKLTATGEVIGKRWGDAYGD